MLLQERQGGAVGAILKGQEVGILCVTSAPALRSCCGLLVLWMKWHFLCTAGETHWPGLDETLLRGLITVTRSGLCSLKPYIYGNTKTDMVPLNWEQLERREGGISDCIFKPDAFMPLLVIQSTVPLNFLRQQLL